ncbi:tetratricopeptide-like helical domain-containing protein, partial [Tanacetum coccineum]
AVKTRRSAFENCKTAKPKPQDPHGAVYTFIESAIADAMWFLPESAPIRTMLTPSWDEFKSNEKSEKIDKALNLISEMHERGIVPNLVTYTSLVNGLCLVGRLEEAFMLFDEIQNHGISPNIDTYFTLINSLWINRKVKEALILLKKMEGLGMVRDIVLSTSIIVGMCKVRKSLLDAGDLLRQMTVGGHELDGVTYSLIITRFVRFNETKIALLYLERMPDAGFFANDFTKSILTHFMHITVLDDASNKLLKRVEVCLQKVSELLDYQIIRTDEDTSLEVCCKVNSVVNLGSTMFEDSIDVLPQDRAGISVGDYSLRNQLDSVNAFVNNEAKYAAPVVQSRYDPSQRAAVEPLPPKGDKGSQNHTMGDIRNKQDLEKLLLNLDKVLWKSNAGKLGGFSVKNVWTDLSEVRPKVPWYKMVWFSQNIPCHAFISWLAINKKLKTQDKVARWQNIDDLKCSLCNLVQDNHSHLFFNCEFSAKVWNHFKDQMRLDYALDDLYQIISYIVARPINRSIWNIIHRLVIGAVVYFLWQEQKPDI